MPTFLTALVLLFLGALTSLLFGWWATLFWGGLLVLVLIFQRRQNAKAPKVKVPHK